MARLNFPAYEFSIREEDDQTYIFDPVRKRYVTLTPEEWVRQHAIQFLLREKGYPAGLLSVEGSISLYRTQKRYDIAAFDRRGHPLLVVECKSYDVALNEAVVDQVIRYNITLKAPYLLLTNGMVHIVLEFAAGGYRQINDLPAFSGIVRGD